VLRHKYPRRAFGEFRIDRVQLGMATGVARSGHARRLPRIPASGPRWQCRDATRARNSGGMAQELVAQRWSRRSRSTCRAKGTTPITVGPRPQHGGCTCRSCPHQRSCKTPYREPFHQLSERWADSPSPA
jgi:hypothetical protein